MEGEIVNVVNLGKEVTYDVKFTNGETVRRHPIDLRPIGNDSTKPPHFTLQDIVESDFHICSKLETLSGKVIKFMNVPMDPVNMMLHFVMERQLRKWKQ